MILVVDDEEYVRELIAEMIAQAGYVVVTAASATEALELARGGVSLVVTDVLMPDMSGIELLRELRRLRPELPVVVVSAAPSVEMSREAFEAGAAGVLAKPFSRAELLEQVTSALGRG